MGKFEQLAIDKIVADGDLDGLIAASILKTYYTDATIIFTHAAEIRGGHLDTIIDKNTAICDLPFHPNCGLYLDHHSTNKPTKTELEVFTSSGGICEWYPVDSAARVAFDLFSKKINLTNLEKFMKMVDKLDSGKITLSEYNSDNPILWLSKTINLEDLDYVHMLSSWFSSGIEVEKILQEEAVISRINIKKNEQSELKRIIIENSEVIDRIAVVKMQDTGYRTNGYLVTSTFGNECDACIIIHGYSDGEIGNHSHYPLSASFYCNSFLHPNQGIFNLTKLAQAFDKNGGGHANACGCRIIPIENGQIIKRKINDNDIENNILEWLKIWSQRN
jgi:oligoribonuclease NrnB/cAMP/cGMP phosphodiesterase (DHH superfamily)